MEFDELERLRTKNLELERINSLLKDQLEYYRMAYFKERETVRTMLSKCDHYYKKYIKYLQKYKDVMNND